MLEFKKPIPLVVMDGKGGWEDGYGIYVSNSGTFEDDVWTVALCKDGKVQHYRSSQIRMWVNRTFDINKQEQL